MLQKLKPYWPTIVAIATSAALAAAPAAQKLIAAHPVLTVIVGAISWLIAHWSPSPLEQSNSASQGLSGTLKVGLILVLLSIPTMSRAQLKPLPKKSVKQHALVKAVKFAATPVTATVVHPVRTLKQIAGSVVFVAEAGVDVVHAGFTALDQATANQEYFGGLHVFFAEGDTYIGKADTVMEKIENYFFGVTESATPAPSTPTQ